MSERVFLWQARVYWEDTDGGGVVYHANFLRFLERARTEWLRSVGVVQTELLRERGLLFVLTSINLDYRRPARLDDLLQISCQPGVSGGARLQFTQRVCRVEQPDLPLVEAQATVACVRASDLRPQRLPDFVRALLERK